MQLPTHPYARSPLIIDTGRVTARDCGHARTILFIQRQIVEELIYAQIRALDAADRVALVEAILSGEVSA